LGTSQRPQSGGSTRGGRPSSRQRLADQCDSHDEWQSRLGDGLDKMVEGPDGQWPTQGSQGGMQSGTFGCDGRGVLTGDDGVARGVVTPWDVSCRIARVS